MKYYFAVPLCLLALTACERPLGKVRHGMPMPVQTFAHIQRLPIAVQSVDVVVEDDRGDDYSADFPVSLDDKVKAYFGNKLDVIGGNGRLVVRVEDSYVEHELIEASSRIWQKVGVGNVNRYAMNLVVRLEHVDASGRVIYGRVLKAQKVVNISEHDSLVERDQQRFDAIEDMFNILDPEVTRIVRDEMNL